MSELVADCPRCGSKKITFDLTQAYHVSTKKKWQNFYEAFCICRNCKRSTVFSLSLRSDVYGTIVRKNILALPLTVNNYMNIEGFIGLKDMVAIKPPEHLTEDIATVFNEGATCLAVNCFNAAGTMFRLCIDLATKSMLPPETDEKIPNAKIRRDLGLRLPWLFENEYLPVDLRSLSTCVKEDGNDGAHAGTLTKDDADDLLDFTSKLLERLYTEPANLRLAEERRAKRRSPKPKP